MPSGRAEASAREVSSPAAAPPDARIAKIARWLGQFSRTLKTCRLYDANNPTAIKFREDLGAQMMGLLDAEGAFELEFSADQVTCDGQPVMTAAASEGGFVTSFHRDGMRTLRFNPGAEPEELDVVVDLVLRVTGRGRNASDDLVTLLWDANLPHVDMSYIASETDADADNVGDGFSLDAPVLRRGKLMPWPDCGSGGDDGRRGGRSQGDDGGGAGGAGGAAGAGDGANGNAGPAVGALDGEAGGTPGAAGDGGPAIESASPDAPSAEPRLRSDDWLAGEPADALEERFAALEAAGPALAELFMFAMREERSAALLPATLALVRETLRSDLLESDRPELVDLLARVMHESVGAANWANATEAVRCLAECTDGWWELASLVEPMASPESGVTAALVCHLDSAPLSEIQEFIGFARNFGPASIEWLMSIVAQANHQRTRRTVAHAVGELCEGHPERLAPWLSDPRWFVVRNAVVILGDTGIGVRADLFRPLLRHPELRVRQAVVAALMNLDADAALPMLLDMALDPDSSVRGAALHRLGAQRSPRVSAALLAIVLDPAFRKRPADDVRAFTTALGGCADDSALPRLEEQLYPPGWFSKGAGPYCQAIARCIARIGTPSAIGRLEAGARSRVAATRDACRLVLKGTGHA